MRKSLRKEWNEAIELYDRTLDSLGVYASYADSGKTFKSVLKEVKKNIASKKKNSLM